MGDRGMVVSESRPSTAWLYTLSPPCTSRGSLQIKLQSSYPSTGSSDPVTMVIYIGMIDHVAKGRGTTGVPWGGGRGYLIRPSKYGEWEESR